MPLQSLYSALESLEAQRVLLLTHPPAGLRAALVVDDRTLGAPMVALRLASFNEASATLAAAVRSARDMTLRCSLAGADAGGGAMVVLDQPGLDRKRAMQWLGVELAELRGLQLLAGPGASQRDLNLIAEQGVAVDPNVERTNQDSCEGVLSCLGVLAERRGKRLGQCTLAIQGCTEAGSRIAERLSQMGCDLVLADHDPARSRALAERVDGRMVPAHGIWSVECDLLVPCAGAGLIGAKTASQIKAWGICGAATSQLAGPEIAAQLQARGVTHVPGVVSSLGGLPEGAGMQGAAMGGGDLAALVDDLLDESERFGRAPAVVAEERAWERIELAG